MSFQQGLSGLNAATKSLEAIGNNVANSSTVGFKQSQVQFSDVYANSLAGTGSPDTGIGVQVARVAQLFSQGTVSVSNNPLDMAINGDGFFRMEASNGNVTFQRNGQFQLTKEGYIENASGQRLTGYKPNANPALGPVNTGNDPEVLIIDPNDLPPRATANYDLTLTLNANKKPDNLTDAGFDAADPLTYSDSTSTPVYDSLGNSHVLRTFYVHTGAGQWSVFATNDGVPTTPAKIGDMTFDANGAMTLPNPPTMSVTMTGSNGAAPFTVAINSAGTQQFAQEFAVNRQNPDGYAPGSLIGFNVSDGGVIMGRYTNGKTAVLGGVALASFANSNGLQNVGNNQWLATNDSGGPMYGSPGTNGLGEVQSSRVEESNVDLTAELVNMITAQRVYQANAQTIKTQDQIMQTLVNLR